MIQNFRGIVNPDPDPGDWTKSRSETLEQKQSIILYFLLKNWIRIQDFSHTGSDPNTRFCNSASRAFGIGALSLCPTLSVFLLTGQKTCPFVYRQCILYNWEDFMDIQYLSGACTEGGGVVDFDHAPGTIPQVNEGVGGRGDKYELFKNFLTFSCKNRYFVPTERHEVLNRLFIS